MVPKVVKKVTFGTIIGAFMITCEKNLNSLAEKLYLKTKDLYI